MVWSKVPSAVTALACAACIAGATALPAADSAAERIANENARLSAFTDVDAFSAVGLYSDILFGTPAQRAAAIAGLDSVNGIPALLAFLGGNIDALAPDSNGNGGYAALSALPIFFGSSGLFTGGGINALSNYAALSAVPSYVALTQATNANDAITALGGIDAFSALPVFRDITNATSLTGNNPNSVASILGGYAALSAADTFFGDGPIGADGVTPIGGVFTGGGIDALAPDAKGNGGYAALSGLPVFFGPNTSGNAPFGTGFFNGGGVNSLTNYAALSAIPAYLTPPATPFAATQNTTKQEAPQTLTPTTLSKTVDTQAPEGKSTADVETPKVSNPITTALSNVTPPSFNSGKQDAPEQAPVTPDTPSLPTSNDKSSLPTGKPSNGSYSGVFKPNNGSPILFGTGGGGSADNGIRGWDKVVSGIKGALGGGDSSSSSSGG